MGKIREEAEAAIKKYGKEAFLNHQDKVFDAIESICFCLEFLQNQEDWGSKRAIPLREDSFTQEVWEEFFSKQYDHDIRRVELMKLRMELDEEDIPLKNFLFQGLDLMINGRWCDLESFMQLMETQIMTDQYMDYRALIEAVYVLGLLEVWSFQCGTRCHFLRGDFRDAEYFRTRISEAIKEQRKNDMERILKERDRRLENMQKEKGGIPILDLFYKNMEGMADADFEKFVTAHLEDPGEEVMWPECSREMNCQHRKIIRILDVAELFVYGGSRLKERLFGHLSGEEQMLVMEWWMANYYPSMLKELVRRLDGMFQAVWPEMVWDEDPEEGVCDSMEIWYEKRKEELRGSVEKVMGRATQERDYEWV